MTPTEAPGAGYVPVATVERGGFVEGVHFGRVVALDAAGAVAVAAGDIDAPMHPRSANKLMQAAAMRGLGLQLAEELLALSAASHWGEPRHVEGVRAILASAGLDESALQTTPDFPEDADARRQAMCSDSDRRPIWHGCSGKHAAMLATCVLHGWDTASYLDPDHPLQVELRAAVEQVIGSSVAHTAVDGCGAPAWAMSLRQLATAYRSGVTAGVGSEIRAVADAMRAHPEFVGGQSSEVTGLMRAVPGLLVKDGAEAVYAAALPDGRAVAVKVADGGFRAGQVVLVDVLRRLGAEAEPGADIQALERWGTVTVQGHGRPVGLICPT